MQIHPIILVVFIGLAFLPASADSAGPQDAEDRADAGLVDVPAAPNGIVGIVRDERGEPLAGVQIGVRPSAFVMWAPYDRSGRGLFGRRETLAQRIERARSEWAPTLDEHVARVRAEWNESFGDIVETTTAEDGSFRFEELPEAAGYQVEYSKLGYEIYGVGSRAIGRGDFLVARAKRLHRIELLLECEDGTQIDEALVRTKRGGSGSGGSWRREHPYIELEDGRYTLQVFAGDLDYRDQGDIASDYVSDAIALEPALQVGPLRIALRPAHGLLVHVDDLWITQGGSGERWLVVRPLAPDEPFDPDSADYARGGVPIHPQDVRSRPRSPQSFPDLSPGRYGVVLRDESGAVVDARLVEALAGRTIVSLVSAPPTMADRLTVKVRDTSGTATEGVRILVDQRIDHNWMPVAAKSLTTPRGEHWVDLTELSDQATSLRVSAVSQEYGIVLHEIATDVRTVELVFPRTGTLVVALVGLERAVLDSSLYGSLQYVGPSSDQRGRYVGHLAIDGRTRPSFGPEHVARCEGLVPGSWRVYVQYTSSEGVPVRLEAGPVEVRSDEVSTVRVEAAQIVDLVVQCGADLAGIHLGLFDPSRGALARKVQIDASGRADFGRMAAGTYGLARVDEYGRRIGNLSDPITVDGSVVTWSGK